MSTPQSKSRPHMKGTGVETMVDIPPSVTYYTDCSISTIHHILQSSRRRLAIGLIAHRAIMSTSLESEPLSNPQAQSDDIAIPVRQLAREIVSIEEDVSIENATGDPYHSVYTALIQTHLPKLDDIAAIGYDADRKIITSDQNLLALSMVTVITSPVAQLLFYDSVAKLYENGSSSIQDSITD